MDSNHDKVEPTVRPCKVCLVCPSLPPDFGGAGERFYRYATRLRQRGQLAFVLTHERQGTCYQNFHSQLPEQKIVRLVAEVNEHATSGSWSRIVSRLWRRVYLLLRVGWVLAARRSHYDVVLAISNSWLCTMAILWTRVLGRKAIYGTSLAGYDDPAAMKQARWPLRYRLLTRAHAVVAISPLLYDLCRDSGIPEEHLHLIGNPVDTDLYCPVDEATQHALRMKLNLPVGKKIIIFVGAMIERKGVDLMPAIFRDVVRAVPSACLVLVGPQDTPANRTALIQRELHECLATRQVILTGCVSNVQEYLQAGDVFLFPSRMEGFGTVLVEAMACGLPSVAHNIKGITRFIITDGVDGFIMPDEDTSAYARTIVRLLTDVSEYRVVSAKAREKAITAFSTEVIDQQYRVMYKKCLE